MFTSEKNGNSIFLPAAGGGSGSSLSSAGSGGGYWSGAFDDGRNAWALSFYSSNVRTDDDDHRNGPSVRPVLE